MSIDNFVPEYWAARTQRHLDARLVYGQPTVINSNYEGEIKQAGDTVHVHKVADNVTVRDYVRNTDIAAPQRPDGSRKSLLIDREKYFNVAVDNVDAVQANVKLFDEHVTRGGRKMAVAIDQDIAAVMIAGAGVVGGYLGTSGVPVTVGNSSSHDYTFYELLVEMRLRLDRNDAPEEDRWVVIPPEIEATGLNDPRLVAIASDVQRTGSLGSSLVGFELLKTTAVPTIAATGSADSDSFGVVFGAGNYATTHANQVTETDAYKMEKQFGEGVKQLQVWGTDVLEPETLGVAVVSKEED